MAKAKIKKGEVDIERMHEETGIPLRKIRKHLGLEPSATLAEARAAFSRAHHGDKQKALEKWASLCATPQEIWTLYQKVSDLEWDTVREQVVPKWIESWQKALSESESFDEVYALNNVRPRTYFYKRTVLPQEDQDSLLKLLVDKLLTRFETADQATKLWKVGSSLLDQKFEVRWVELCKAPSEIKDAFEACRGSIKELALKRFATCVNPDELKKAFNKSRYYGNLDEIEAAYVTEMAEFYRK